MLTTLLAAALGIAGTLTGVVITQRQSNRRDAIAWQRERTKEQERWDREDIARTFEHRRTAYVEFYESLRDMIFLIYNHGMGLGDGPEDQATDDGPGASTFGTMGADFQLPTFRKLQHLQIYATPSVIEAANTVYNAAWRWGAHTTFGQDDDQFYGYQSIVDDNEAVLLAEIRHDLKIPETSTALMKASPSVGPAKSTA